MRKVLLTIGLIFMGILPACAEYKPIPPELSRQYKAEMEQIINEEYPKVLELVDNELESIKKSYENMVKNGYNLEDDLNMTLTMEISMPAADIDLYDTMMKITQEKYLKIQYEPIGTDCVNPIYDFLKPYFDDNKINMKKLNKIIKYENKKIKVAEKYIKKIDRLRI